jgi:hypothetical protein
VENAKSGEPTIQKSARAWAAPSAAGDKQKRESVGPDKRKSIEKKLKVAKAYIAKMEQFAEKDTTTEDKGSE